ncbi:MAG: MBL fold metallo-hydrolase [Sulfurimicrobium sp.]|jgi:metallo-beta-lactamase family protein|nr:MBL fold metallo-hydrolase [Sulfurimicrobium sp.]
MKIQFHGASREVTGSCYVLEAAGVRFLVDCGMFQGGREARDKNYAAFEFDPRQIDFVLLTHAHIDHSGMLPRLVADGFGGPIYTTHATRDLLEIMLRDSAHIQEKEAEWGQYTKGRNSRQSKDIEVKPLYTLDEANACLSQLQAVSYDSDLSLHASVRCKFRDAGHILGSAIIEVWADDAGQTQKLVFSGDLGNAGQPILQDPAIIESADVLLVESTYGDRLHKTMDQTMDELVHAVTDTLKRKGGNVIIPAFTVGRTQEIIYLLYDLTRQGRLHDLDIYVDSPMATSATEITMKHIELMDTEARGLMQWMKAGHKVPRIQFTETVEDSMALNHIKGGAIIISASGMCDAGRIKHHLRYNLGRPECTVLITGFQAGGTLGRRLVDGAKMVRIFGQEIPVRADLYTIGGLSAHADQAGLLSWLGHFKKPPRHTFIVHGEENVAFAFADLIRENWNWHVEVPGYRDEFEL